MKSRPPHHHIWSTTHGKRKLGIESRPDRIGRRPRAVADGRGGAGCGAAARRRGRDCVGRGGRAARSGGAAFGAVACRGCVHVVGSGGGSRRRVRAAAGGAAAAARHGEPADREGARRHPQSTADRRRPGPGRSCRAEARARHGRAAPCTDAGAALGLPSVAGRAVAGPCPQCGPRGGRRGNGHSALARARRTAHHHARSVSASDGRHSPGHMAAAAFPGKRRDPRGRAARNRVPRRPQQRRRGRARDLRCGWPAASPPDAEDHRRHVCRRARRPRTRRDLSARGWRHVDEDECDHAAAPP